MYFSSFLKVSHTSNFGGIWARFELKESSYLPLQLSFEENFCTRSFWPVKTSTKVALCFKLISAFNYTRDDLWLFFRRVFMRLMETVELFRRCTVERGSFWLLFYAKKAQNIRNSIFGEFLKIMKNTSALKKRNSIIIPTQLLKFATTLRRALVPISNF